MRRNQDSICDAPKRLAAATPYRFATEYETKALHDVQASPF